MEGIVLEGYLDVIPLRESAMQLSQELNLLGCILGIVGVNESLDHVD